MIDKNRRNFDNFAELRRGASLWEEFMTLTTAFTFLRRLRGKSNQETLLHF